MILPKQLLLQTIAARNIHLDIHSKEKSTNVVKPKYKLAGNRFPGGGMLFWVTTGKDYTYPKNKTIKLTHPGSYEECSANPLKSSPSYVCIERTDYLLDDEIYNKYTNAANGFKKVAKIKPTAFKKLVELRSKLWLNSNTDSREKIHQIILATVSSDENVDDIISAMGL